MHIPRLIKYRSLPSNNERTSNYSLSTAISRFGSRNQLQLHGTNRLVHITPPRARFLQTSDHVSIKPAGVPSVASGRQEQLCHTVSISVTQPQPSDAPILTGISNAFRQRQPHPLHRQIFFQTGEFRPQLHLELWRTYNRPKWENQISRKANGCRMTIRATSRPSSRDTPTTGE